MLRHVSAPQPDVGQGLPVYPHIIIHLIVFFNNCLSTINGKLTDRAPNKFQKIYNYILENKKRRSFDGRGFKEGSEIPNETSKSQMQE